MIIKEEFLVLQNMMFSFGFFDGDVFSWQSGLITFNNL